MAFAILGSPKPQFFDSSGAPLTSGTLTVVEPSTDVNKASYPTYDDAEASPPTNPNANPITLDARGECDLWGIDGEDYKLTLKDSAGNTIWTTDDVFLPYNVTASFINALTPKTIRANARPLSMLGQSVTVANTTALYVRNATIVEDRTLLASASATTLNNNNVLAALIADLKAGGVIQ